MTSSTHQSGMDRCAEVVSKVSGFDIAINIQGDEPFISPVQIELLSNLFQDPATEIGTLIQKIDSLEKLFNESIPKVVVNSKKEAMYFSRKTTPFQRGTKQNERLNNHIYFKHS